MGKWKDTSKHWSKTEKRKETLEKVKKSLISDNWTGKKRDEKTVKALQDGRTRWIAENPEKFRASRVKAGKAIMGEKNRNWTGGKWKYIKKVALIRDDYTCQICGLRDVEIMDVDHIIPKIVRSDLTFELDNLMTLCPNCHRRKTLREHKNKVYSSLS